MINKSKMLNGSFKICNNYRTHLTTSVEKNAKNGTGSQDGFRRVLAEYRQCELHAIRFNRVYSVLNAMLHNTLITMIIFSIYATMRTEGALAAIASYWAFLALVFYLPAANSYAEINRESRVLLNSLCRSWSNSRGGRYS